MRFAERVALRYFLAKTMTRDEAAKILGVSPDASEDEITRAYRRKAIENHPDKGGDNEVMVKVNLAKEILDGKTDPAPSRRDDGPSYQPKWEPPPKRVVRITFEDALKTAGIPSGVEWKFRTATAYGGTGDNSYAGAVLYGQTATAHVFTSFYNRKEQSLHTGIDSDIWDIETHTFSLDNDLAPLANRVCKEMHGGFTGTKRGFNGQVVLHKAGTALSPSILYGGTPMKLQDALEKLGLGGAPKADRKLTVVMVLTHDHHAEIGQEGNQITLRINGTDHELSKASVHLIQRKSKVLGVLFGTYFYWAGDKKDVTRSKSGKAVLLWLSEKLTDEPQALRDQLAQAAGQMK